MQVQDRILKTKKKPVASRLVRVQKFTVAIDVFVQHNPALTSVLWGTIGLFLKVSASLRIEFSEKRKKF